MHTGAIATLDARGIGARVILRFQHLKASNIALFYEYLTTKTSQGDPSRESGALALCFFAAAVRTRPMSLFSMWRRPWVLRGLAKAFAWRVGGGRYRLTTSQ